MGQGQSSPAGAGVPGRGSGQRYECYRESGAPVVTADAAANRCHDSEREDTLAQPQAVPSRPESPGRGKPWLAGQGHDEASELDFNDEVERSSASWQRQSSPARRVSVSDVTSWRPPVETRAQSKGHLIFASKVGDAQIAGAKSPSKPTTNVDEAGAWTTRHVQPTSVHGKASANNLVLQGIDDDF
ncbi:hypothetical protein T492DRAFT_1066771 [Pavlovales sp. CCMP2436]|nr:hypothetical protein T492DRAFT_1066771 [Pavlovales sp. CCMP2436]|mmetsp:Transcript_6498/g.16907  ORF Transcript_6498/g.16907 Transcript_6498/m.16907 type:complete len:186 (-) Transcript_6498:185-742(-)